MDHTHAAAGAGIAGLILLAMLLALYLLPTIVAVIRKNRQALAIFVLNLLLGWTAIFWIIALVWAFTANQPPQTVIVNTGSSPQA